MATTLSAIRRRRRLLEANRPLGDENLLPPPSAVTEEPMSTADLYAAQDRAQGVLPPRRASMTPYDDILSREIQRYRDRPPTAGEISDVSKEIRTRLPFRDQVRLFFQTGMGTRDRTAAEMGAFGQRASQDWAAQDQIVADANRRKQSLGIMPEGEIYGPREQAAVRPLVDIAAQMRQQALQQQQVARNRAYRQSMNIDDATKWNAADMTAWDMGQLKSVTQIRPVPPQAQFQQMSVGGRTYVKPPAGFQEQQPQQQTPADKTVERVTIADIARVNAERTRSGSKAAQLAGKVKSLKEKVKRIAEDLSSKAPTFSPKALDKAATELRIAEETLNTLIERDKRLMDRETQLRKGIGAPEAMPFEYFQTDEGVRSNEPVPETLGQYQFIGEFQTPEEVADWIIQTHPNGLGQGQMLALLRQHKELSDEDLQAAAEYMTMIGIPADHEPDETDE